MTLTVAYSPRLPQCLVGDSLESDVAHRQVVVDVCYWIGVLFNPAFKINNNIPPDDHA